MTPPAAIAEHGTDEKVAERAVPQGTVDVAWKNDPHDPKTLVTFFQRVGVRCLLDPETVVDPLKYLESKTAPRSRPATMLAYQEFCKTGTFGSILVQNLTPGGQGNVGVIVRNREEVLEEAPQLVLGIVKRVESSSTVAMKMTRTLEANSRECGPLIVQKTVRRVDAETVQTTAQQLWDLLEHQQSFAGTPRTIGGNLSEEAIDLLIEYVHGLDLDVFQRRGESLTTEEVVLVFAKLADQLHAAHAEGILHRDIKPANVVITVEGGLVQPKILDYGLAKSVYDVNVTTDTIKGTPAYWAPEQVRPGSAPLSAEARAKGDVFAMGIMMLEMLAQRPLFHEREILTMIAARQNVEGVREQIARVHIPGIELIADKAHRELLEGLLALAKRACDPDYAQRPTSAQMKAAFDVLRKKISRDDAATEGSLSSGDAYLIPDVLVADDVGTLHDKSRVAAQSEVDLGKLQRVDMKKLITDVLLETHRDRERKITASARAQIETVVEGLLLRAGNTANMTVGIATEDLPVSGSASAQGAISMTSPLGASAVMAAAPSVTTKTMDTAPPRKKIKRNRLVLAGTLAVALLGAAAAALWLRGEEKPVAGEVTDPTKDGKQQSKIDSPKDGNQKIEKPVEQPKDAKFEWVTEKRGKDAVITDVTRVTFRSKEGRELVIEGERFVKVFDAEGRLRSFFVGLGVADQLEFQRSLPGWKKPAGSGQPQKMEFFTFHIGTEGHVLVSPPFIGLVAVNAKGEVSNLQYHENPEQGGTKQFAPIVHKNFAVDHAKSLKTATKLPPMYTADPAFQQNMNPATFAAMDFHYGVMEVLK